jgi:uncharacterized protein YndB with AHSA1/START domain
MSQLTTHPETQVTLDKDIPIVRITREFEAPVAKVYRAHVDADLYGRWIGPRDLSTTISQWDCRTGGSWRFVQADGEGNSYEFYGSFHEVRPDESIVQTFTFVGFPDSVSLDRVSFEDLGDGRSRLVATSLLDSFEARDAMVEAGMEQGITEGYEKLDDVLVTTGTS